MAAMLRNKFRKFIGIVILVVFGVAIVRFAAQTSGNLYVGGALAFGLKVVLFLALILWLVYLFDRRVNKRQQ
jgi:membrane protein implicated in regulation of membrane protease activity